MWESVRAIQARTPAVWALALALLIGAVTWQAPANSLISAARAQADFAPDPNVAANTLFVEAIEHILAADDAAAAAARLDRLRRAEANIDRIIADHPGSELAVQLITGQRIGWFDPAAFDRAVARTEEEVPAAAERDQRCGAMPVACLLLADASATAAEISHDHYRSRAIGLIAEGQAKVGLTETARFTLAHGLAGANGAPHSYVQLEAVREVVNALAALGLFAEALATAADIADDEERDEALHDITVAQAVAALFADALATADRIRDEGLQSEALRDIAAAQGAAGNIAEALVMARGIADDLHRSEALRLIAVTQADEGHFDDALQTARDIPGHTFWYRQSGSIRSKTFRYIAVAQAEAGHLAEALITARGVESRSARAEALGLIAAFQAAAGSTQEAQQVLAEALTTAGEVAEPVNRLDRLVIVASALGQAGLVEDAQRIFADTFSIIGEIEDVEFRPQLLSMIASYQTEAGFVDQGRRTFAEALSATDELVPRLRNRMIGMSAIAYTQAEAGLVEDARQTFAQVAALSHGVEDEFDSDYLLNYIVFNQADAAAASLWPGWVNRTPRSDGGG